MQLDLDFVFRKASELFHKLIVRPDDTDALIISQPSCVHMHAFDQLQKCICIEKNAVLSLKKL